ncbi:hypothetical protein KB559_20565 [Paenibacillus sp. Marseille-P2973]|uniref:hypothetical protein n=1 Tax=Paenibacillus sp. Marseille-P2973 TaxID=1871032 RepID=UPI001B36AB7C|nr:hypothetical protein [Paenibacillus sp. Marseille-P2973]MBQ4901240.1 hypothetical protein [Paenibacillus sp. Marseille-P2973]
MKKTLILPILLSLALTACGGMSEEEKEFAELYEQVTGEKYTKGKGEELQKQYEQLQEESKIKNEQKEQSSDYLFGFLQIDDFIIDRGINRNDKAKAKLTNNSRWTLDGHIGLVVYDKDMSIIDTQYVSLPNVGLEPDEAFIVDEYINKDNYYTLKFADVDMLRQK